MSIIGELYDLPLIISIKSKNISFFHFSRFSRAYELLNGGSYRPPKVLKFFVLKRRFQICKKHLYRPKGSGDIAFQSKDEFFKNASILLSLIVFYIKTLPPPPRSSKTDLYLFGRKYLRIFCLKGLNSEFSIQTCYSGGSRLTFKPRLILKCIVPLSIK